MFLSHFSFLVRRSGVVLLLALWGIAATAQAADPSVRARLNRRISVIGDPVQLEVKVSGARQVGDPPDVKVDGLEIRYLGPSQNTVMRFENGSFTSERTTTLVYQVVPGRNGTFTIPALTVEADGKSYRTEPVALTVQPSSATDGSADLENPGFAEFSVPKKTLYLGEAMPVELRLYVDSRVRWQPVAMPEFDGEGYTKQNMPKPRVQQVEKNGRDYDMAAFKTAITPIRAGKITLGPSEIQYAARVPHARRSGGRSPFDMLDDVFSDPFFSATQQLTAKAEAVELTVNPLPLAGKPADFSGVVGDFQLSAEGAPKQVKVGDPITMKLRVSGHGDFDRVPAPVLVDSTGWRTYPPSSTFKADDDLNTSGTKTFEVAVVPETKKTAMPVFHFSYFDPLAGKYRTLSSEAAPLAVEGNAAPTPVPVAAAPESANPPPKKPAAEQRPNDIVGLRYDRDEPEESAPLYEQRGFWLVQGGVAVVWLGLIGFRLRRPPNALVQQKVALRQEREAVWRRLRRTELGHVDFFDAAARLAQIDVALATGRPVATIDSTAVRSSVPLDDTAAATIEDIFNARAELHYAGGASGDGRVSSTERERVLTALKQLEKNHARN